MAENSDITIQLLKRRQKHFTKVLKHNTQIREQKMIAEKKSHFIIFYFSSQLLFEVDESLEYDFHWMRESVNGIENMFELIRDIDSKSNILIFFDNIKLPENSIAFLDRFAFGNNVRIYVYTGYNKVSTISAHSQQIRVFSRKEKENNINKTLQEKWWYKLFIEKVCSKNLFCQVGYTCWFLASFNVILATPIIMQKVEEKLKNTINIDIVPITNTLFDDKTKSFDVIFRSLLYHITNNKQNVLEINKKFTISLAGRLQSIIREKDEMHYLNVKNYHNFGNSYLAICHLLNIALEQEDYIIVMLNLSTNYILESLSKMNKSFFHNEPKIVAIISDSVDAMNGICNTEVIQFTYNPNYRNLKRKDDKIPMILGGSKCRLYDRIIDDVNIDLPPPSKSVLTYDLQSMILHFGYESFGTNIQHVICCLTCGGVRYLYDSQKIFTKINWIDIEELMNYAKSQYPEGSNYHFRSDVYIYEQQDLYINEETFHNNENDYNTTNVQKRKFQS
jgi:hypothetical protein